MISPVILLAILELLIYAMKYETNWKTSKFGGPNEAKFEDDDKDKYYTNEKSSLFFRERDKTKIYIDNMYTVNHIKYNTCALRVCAFYAILTIIGVSRFRILPMYCCRKSCLDYFYHLVLLILRIIFLGYIISIEGREVLRLIFVKTWRILYENWWTEEDIKAKNFVTNANYFNATLCWILWSMFAIP